MMADYAIVSDVTKVVATIKIKNNDFDKTIKSILLRGIDDFLVNEGPHDLRLVDMNDLTKK